jgi:hypothetical protein
MLEPFLFDGLLSARPISSNGDDCHSVPEADAHSDAPAAPTPTPTPTATSPADARAVLASFGASAIAMLAEIRAWANDDDKRITEPFVDYIRKDLGDVAISRFGCRYYGLGLATSDFELCFMQQSKVDKMTMIRGQSRMALNAAYDRRADQSLRAGWAYLSCDILKRAMESRSQPQRDALLAFKLLAHYLRFVHCLSEAKGFMWTNIALSFWALAVVDCNLVAFPEEDDTSFAKYLHNIICFLPL